MFTYSFKSLLSKKTISVLFSLAIVIAISISMLAINITSQVEEGFYQVDKKYDLIIGPNGSDTQLVMSSLFFADDPLGTISEEYINEILENYTVEKMIPLAIADYYQDSRIVGTTSELLDQYQLKEGNYFVNDFEIVIGTNVAEKYDISIGDSIITAHGTGALAEEHAHNPYIVVGILEKSFTAYDNTCFTKIESVHKSHEESSHDEESLITDIIEDSDEIGIDHEEHEHEEDHDHEGESQGYTALLIRTGNMSVASALETDFSENTEIQIVNTTKVLRKLVGNIDMSKQVALLLCGIIIILAVLLTCVMSFLMLTNLKKDINLFEFLGLKKTKIYSYVLWQIAILLAISMSISLVINRLVLVIANSISAQLGIVLNLNKIYPSEIYIVLVYIGIVIVSTMIYTYVTVKKEN